MAVPKPQVRGGVLDDANGALPAAHQSLTAVVHHDHFQLQQARSPPRYTHAFAQPPYPQTGGDYHCYEQFRQFLILA